ncbi:TIGR04086 family membrane protein [Brevibacillus ginsengisoli]|uniref:TIGR04086 family membrane protein n=1 Tax=Brevibacillus ginsengisoli TaxID=363854 RepID=UPI003CF4F01C
MRTTSSSIITGLLFTFGLVLIGALVTALLLSFTNLRENSLSYFTIVINCIGLLVGGWVTGRRCGSKGWYYGGLTGLSYFLLVLLIGFLGFDTPLKMATLFYLVAAFVISAMGGVVGVNMSRR